jgi:hypothetical protein
MALVLMVTLLQALKAQTPLQAAPVKAAHSPPPCARRATHASKSPHLRHLQLRYFQLG